MLIVKPYGKSVVERGQERQLSRKNGGENKPIPEFAQTHPDLVIAQWISVIDKIITKPKGDVKATHEQDQYRKALGNAVWEVIYNKKLIVPANDKPWPYYRKIWDWKIAPYNDVHKKNEKYTEKNIKNLQGRWYSTFIETSPPDWNKVAQKIEAHLYKGALRKGVKAQPVKRSGLIVLRAESIQKNILSEKDLLEELVGWDEYAKKGDDDIAAKIYNRIPSDRIPRPRDIANYLYDHWKIVFGPNTSIKDAQDKHPELFAVHMAIKDYYTRTLKDTRNKDVAKTLPRNMAALRDKICAKRVNRDINALIRLGKIIHYTASGVAPDSVSKVAGNFPDEAAIKSSPFWSSEGQAQIKRNEAFVRVWRRVLVLAARTLKDWADPDDNVADDDILGGNIEQDLGGRRYNSLEYKEKVRLVLAERWFSDFFVDENTNKAVLGTALFSVTWLRHAAFHFKGLNELSSALTNLESELNKKTQNFKKNNNSTNFDYALAEGVFKKFWSEEEQKQKENLIENMQASHFDNFFNQDEIKGMAQGIAGAEIVPLPLPKFTKILVRANDAWRNLPEGFDKTILPEPHNRAEMEQSEQFLCQYIGLKMVYSGPFSAWLFEQKHDVLQQWLDLSIARTEAAARNLNGKKVPDEEMIVAKAAGEVLINERTSIIDIFSQLSALTASKMLVQRRYNSDAENARKQASYLEKVKCDIVLKAFEAFLKSPDGRSYAKLLKMTKIEHNSVNWDAIKEAVAKLDPVFDPWQALFFFLLHLVPVDAVNDLYHQIRKWDVLSEKADKKPKDQPDASKILRVLKLYLDRHDAKFSGGMEIGLNQGEKQQLEQFFEDPSLIQQLFPQDKPDIHVPIRGLREFLRFGHFDALMPILDKQKITKADCKKYSDAKGSVANAQNRREELHKKWARPPKDPNDKKKKIYMNAAEYKEYAVSLKTVMQHRHLTAHVMLQNHVWLHHLAMAVLGRLIDYVGLWERDVYFVALALISKKSNASEIVDKLTFEDNKKDKKPTQVVKGVRNAIVDKLTFEDNKEVKKLTQVVNGVRNAITDANAVAPELVSQFKTYFPDWDNESDADPVKIRNDLAHLNMLQKKNCSSSALNLTEWVNKTRILMAYDRKMKNAVTKSVIELLAREGVHLGWDMCTQSGPHHVTRAVIKPKQAPHLGGKKFPHARQKDMRGKSVCYPLLEDLHGPAYLKMVAGLFDGDVEKAPASVLDDGIIENIEWAPGQGNNHQGKKGRR